MENDDDDDYDHFSLVKGHGGESSSGGFLEENIKFGLQRLPCWAQETI